MNWKWFLLLVPILLIAALSFWVPQPLVKASLVKILEAETDANVSIGRVQLSWLGPQTIHSLEIQGSDFKIPIEKLQVAVPLWKLPGLFKLKHLDANFNIENGSLQFPDAQVEEISGTTRVKNDAAEFSFSNPSGSFLVQGQISHLSAEVPDFSLRAHVSSFPTLLLDRLAHLKAHSLEPILGPAIQTKIVAVRKNQSGTLDATLWGSGAQAELHARFTDDALTLQEPFIASIVLTPQLAEWLLCDINPLFLTGVGAINPIQIRVEPDGFRCPLLRWKEIAIGHGTIDVGQIRCQNGGSLATLIGILKNSRLSHVDEMNVWCTPISFSLHQGILHTDRMDALVADSVHICTWGDIDLNRNHLDMILGLPADTLQQSFGITDVSSLYVLKIPLTGKIGKPKLAASTAAAKIAALIAAQKGTRKTPFNGIVNIFTQPDSDVPPPHLPFPWQKQGYAR